MMYLGSKYGCNLSDSDFEKLLKFFSLEVLKRRKFTDQVRLNKYLKNNYNKSLYDVLRALVDDIVVVNNGIVYLFDFNSAQNKRMYDLITYGNREVRGTSTFRDLLRCALSNI